jgi:dihydroxyacetone kinase
MKPANEMVERMYGEIKKEMELKEGQEIAVLVNGLGSTTLLELNIVYFDLDKHLKKDGIVVYDSEINQFCTCQEMGGFSITIMKLDDELKMYYSTPCYSPYYAREAIE